MLTRPSALLIYTVNPSYLELKFSFFLDYIAHNVLFYWNVEEIMKGTSEKAET